MSLVGSLEDLGLGDILQIVSLSRKSGLLQLRSEQGEGRIVFHDGLVRAGFVKGEAEDLKDLLVSGGFVAEDDYQRAAQTALAHGDPVADTLASMTSLTRERIDSLRREHVERSVFAMFGWATGEFSFEVRDDVDPRDRELMLSTGINPQYLTMEATRIDDEGGVASEPDVEFGTVDETPLTASDPIFDAAPDEADVAAGDPADADLPDAALEATEVLALASVQRADAEELEDDAPEPELPEIELSDPVETTEVTVTEADAAPAAVEVSTAEDDAAPTATEESAAAAEAAPAAVEVSADASDAAPAEVEVAAPGNAASAAPALGAATDAGEKPGGSVIVIDPDLTALEWQKVALAGLFRRVHIFQAAEGGISRLRQYLRRGELPVVIVADASDAGGLYGAESCDALVGRIRAHARKLPIFVVQSAAGTSGEAFPDGVARLQRPPNHQLANRRAWPRYRDVAEELGASVRRALAERRRTAERPPAPADAPAAEEARATAALRRLKQTSDRLRDPSAQGEVLSLIVDFAAQCFSRVAVFMVRDDDAVAMVQSGLERAGGPDAATFEQIQISADEPRWFSEVLASRRGAVAPPRNDGDRRLAGLLGARAPAEAYVAPIESGNRVVALVYVDNLPGDEPVGDTASLEIVLHEAGLALERALLERALADADR